MEKILEMVIGTLIAVGLSAVIFIGANLLFDLAPTRWEIFGAVAGGGLVLIFFFWLFGNRAITALEVGGGRNPTKIPWQAIVAAIVGGAVGFFLARLTDRNQRLMVGVGGGAVLGLILGLTLVEEARPRLDVGPTITGLVAGLVIGGAIMFLRKGTIRSLVLGGTLGFALGAWGGPGDGGTAAQAVIVSLIVGAGLGVYAGMAKVYTHKDRTMLSERARAIIFVAPALIFIGITLVIPTVRTIYLSLFNLAFFSQTAEREPYSTWTGIFGEPFFIAAVVLVLIGVGYGFYQGSRNGGGYKGNGISLGTYLGGATLFIFSLFIFTDTAEFVGGENYGNLFTDPNTINLSNWTDIFTSQLFQIGVVIALIGVLVGFVAGANRGQRFQSGGASTGSIAVGSFIGVFSLGTVLRGTIMNNLWWVFTVTILATVFGLAIAVLADRSAMESLAKSIIFMPMAISFVGAAIIWRFMYIARPEGEVQTGVFNAIWVWLGDVSGSGGSSAIAAGIMLVVVAMLGYLAYRGFSHNVPGVAWGSVITAIPFLWLAWRFIGPGLGADVEADTVKFLTESPFNNVWMMVVLIWIQTGFTMVIFSAAIKAVPAELIEAAKVDGATENQTFWSVVIPQIAPTIGVVVTTLIVLVMKVFDIPKVMTNGNFDTEVIANEMWQRAFTELDFGLGSALAVILFVSVLPIMYINIRRMQKAAA
ncbi:MAG: sugar ABC transporter permease [Acidimicrobiia bacterium]|nr:sugar ABC transporter permease [Acidimicrobiia bacterium]NNC74347.1 sugar ABC transporter permease [Acidimicrobiia bacterium]